jgi:hypothetical protein
MASEEFPYLYQGIGREDPGVARLAIENHLGSRDAGSLAQQGLASGLLLSYGVTDRITFSGELGMQDLGSASTHTSWAIGLNVRLLRQEQNGLNVDLQPGFKQDFEAVNIPLLRLSMNRRWGNLDLSASGLAELPQAAWRDDVDLIMSSGLTYRVRSWYRLGVELAGEDLEGFWENEEAEGGATVLVGPTAWFKLAEKLECKFNAGYVYAATSNVAIHPGGADYSNQGDAMLARVALSFRL